MQKPLPLISFSLLFALSSFSKAQHVEDSETPVFLSTQVVTATGSSHELDDSIIRTEVITAEQLEFMQAKVLVDALKHSPGLKIQRTVKNGSKLSIQGADANHVLILKDGLPFISPTGSETDLSQIPLLGIERIEIIKGAGSALYGSSAMGGVINLISKQVEGDNIELDISRGEYWKTEEQKFSGNSIKKESLFAYKKFSDTKLSTQLYRELTPQIDLNKDTKTVDGSDQKLQSAEFRVDQPIGKVQSFLRATYLTDHKKKNRADEFYPGLGAFDSYYESDSERKSLDGGITRLDSILFDQGSILFRYEDYTEISGNYDQAVKDQKQRDVSTQLGKVESQFSKFLSFGDIFSFLPEYYQNVLSPITNHNFSYGLSYQNNKMQQKKRDGGVIEIPDKSTHTIEAYIQDSFMLNQSNEIIIGARRQHDSDFGYHNSVKANWMLTVDEWKLRVSYGKGYRTPNLKERFYLFDHSNLGYIINGNLDLKPETSDNLNATISYRLQDTSIDVGIFYNKFKDKIDTVSDRVEEGISYYNYQNITKAFTRGGEVTVTWQPNKTFYWQNSFSVLNAINEENDRRIENQPKYTFKTQLNKQMSNSFTLSLYGIIEKDRYNGLYDSDNDQLSDSYITSVTDVVQTWDIKFDWQVIPELSFYGAVENIFNETKSITYNTVSENDERPIEPTLMRLGVNLAF